MKRAYRKVAIVVEGDVFATRSGIAPEALVGAMSYATVIEGIPIVSTHNTSHTAEMMVTMARHATQGLGYEIALRGGKPKDRSPQAQYLVEGLPNVGPTASRKLLEHFGSAGAIFAADEVALRAVPGVGPKTIATIREVLAFDVRTTSC